MKQIKVLLNDTDGLVPQFERLCLAAKEYIVGQRLELILRPLTKSRAQEMHYHSLIADIARHTDIGGSYFSEEAWKAKLVWDFEQTMKQAKTPLRHGGYTTLALDGMNIIQIRPSTTQFTLKEGSEFIEYLYATGAELDVKWTDKRYLDYRGN